MCSIAGLVWDVNDASAETLRVVRRMNRALKHRGPDGEGAAIKAEGRLTLRRWTGTGAEVEATSRNASPGVTVGLGMNRLAIRDVEAGHQPMTDDATGVVIVFNGEIYNCDELTATLGHEGSFRTRSDTEVILRAYLKWGRACVDRLAGMFAFAIWDERDQSLFIARDRLGIKPLVWAATRGGLVFASELRALLASGLVQRTVRPAAVNGYLYHLYVPPPDGPLEGVNILEPGHTLLFRNGDIRIERYWQLSFAHPFRSSHREQTELFRSLLANSVRSHLASDVPLGAFLSGGLDSSAIVALMKQVAAERVHTFTVGFDVESYDESSDAAASASYLKTQHHEVRLPLASLEEDIVKVLTHYDQPFGDASAVPTYVLCRETARSVKVALAGDGSDEQLAGYPRARNFAILDGLRRAPAIPRQALLWAAGRASGLLGGRLRRRAKNLAGFADIVNGADPMRSYIYLRDAFRNGWRERLLVGDLARLADRGEGCAHIYRAAEASGAPDEVTKMLAVEIATYLPYDILQKVDTASGAHGLEVRVPFLDHRLVEAVARMALSLKLGPRRTKVVLRRAMAPELPPHALVKRKQGFHLPVAEWLRGRGKELVFDLVLSPRAVQRGYFRAPALETLVREHVDHLADHGSMLWALLQLELWHRTWVDA